MSSVDFKSCVSHEDEFESDDEFFDAYEHFDQEILDILALSKSGQEPVKKEENKGSLTPRGATPRVDSIQFEKR